MVQIQSSVGDHILGSFTWSHPRILFKIPVSVILNDITAGISRGDVHETAAADDTSIGHSESDHRSSQSQCFSQW